VWQRFNDRGVDRQHRIEQMRKVDALGLGHKAKESAIAVEAPGPPFLDDFEIGFAITIEQLVADLARRVLVSQFDSVRAKPLHADHGDDAAGQNSTDRPAGPQFFKSRHFRAPPAPSRARRVADGCALARLATFGLRSSASLVLQYRYESQDYPQGSEYGANNCREETQLSRQSIVGV